MILTTCICTHIRVGHAAVIPVIPMTTSTTTRHHLHHDSHTHAYQKSQGMMLEIESPHPFLQMSPSQSGPPAG
ncbi:hypothetical protein EDC04DRAFT_2716997 [Pisolithus marmoratus]|nr:hypothetical protein EDC04DRAFT_2716997 [Pisolithus marmoratus]